jgi:nuclear pore complex protein Nup98-Nup96
LETLGYKAKLRRIREKRGTIFLKYRPGSGSCVFKVEHFSKYTLSDFDDEGEPRADPKKAKLMTPVQNGKSLEKIMNVLLPPANGM